MCFCWLYTENFRTEFEETSQSRLLISRLFPGIILIFSTIFKDGVRLYDAITREFYIFSNFILFTTWRIWEVFDRLSYRPDLSPSGYYLFQKLKELLGGVFLDIDKEFKSTVKTWLKRIVVNFYDEGI